MTKTITALSAQKRNPQRINVYLDGEFAFGLARIVAAWLTVGQQLSEEKIAQLQAEDQREVAYQKALNFLNYRLRTEAEVRRKLADKEIPEATIEGVVERLKNNGLLDDARFARMWVDQRSELRPRSRRALEYELKQRGIEPQAITESLLAIDEDAMAYELAQRKARRFAHLDWQQFRQKIYRALAQRGFNYDIISTVTQRVWDEMQHSQEEEAYP